MDHPEPERTTTQGVPAIESRYDRSRQEWNLLIRRPFYMNLRLGRTQNALWFGRSTGAFFQAFNRFPLRSPGPRTSNG